MTRPDIYDKGRVSQEHVDSHMYTLVSYLNLQYERKN